MYTYTDIYSYISISYWEITITCMQWYFFPFFFDTLHTSIPMSLCTYTWTCNLLSQLQKIGNIQQQPEQIS